MPILKREISISPGELLDEEYQECRGSEGARWWAVYTLARHEKEFMRRLLRQDIPFYCPVVSRPYRSSQGRLRTSHLPLFPGYVFLFGTAEQRLDAYTTNCISRCLEVGDHEQLVNDLRQIALLIDSDYPLTVEASLTPGMPVRVKSGPFAGIEGTVFERRNESRLLVMVNFLQQGASLVIHDWELEPL